MRLEIACQPIARDQYSRARTRPLEYQEAIQLSNSAGTKSNPFQAIRSCIHKPTDSLLRTKRKPFNNAREMNRDTKTEKINHRHRSMTHPRALTERSLESVRRQFIQTATKTSREKLEYVSTTQPNSGECALGVKH